jgi:hypothetical protein
MFYRGYVFSNCERTVSDGISFAFNSIARFRYAVFRGKANSLANIMRRRPTMRIGDRADSVIPSNICGSHQARVRLRAARLNTESNLSAVNGAPQERTHGGDAQ